MLQKWPKRSKGKLLKMDGWANFIILKKGQEKIKNKGEEVSSIYSLSYILSRKILDEESLLYSIIPTNKYNP